MSKNFKKNFKIANCLKNLLKFVIKVENYSMFKKIFLLLIIKLYLRFYVGLKTLNNDNK